MFLILTLIVLTSTILYFYFLWLRFFALFPLVILVIWFTYFALKTPISFSKFEISKYSLHIAWSIVLFSIFGILSFVGIEFPNSLLFMFVGNFVLWSLSYFLNYNDGNKIFQFWYYLLLFLIIILGLFIIPPNQLLMFFIMILCLNFWFVWFLKYIIGIWIKIEDEIFYTIFVSWLLLIWLLIVWLIPSLPASLSLISVILMFLYMWFWLFIQKKPSRYGHISVRRILAGERVTQKMLFSNNFLTQMYNFVVDMPQKYRYVLEFVNVLVVMILLWSFVVNWSNIEWLSHLFYWVVISIFVWNVLLLKKMDYTSFLQNLFLFLIINFAVYISLFSYFESNIQSIVFWSVIWNVLTSLLLFVLPPKYKKLFTYKDYRYWIVASIMSFLVNVILLLKSGLAGELIFFLLLLYVGVEAILVFYGIKHIGKNFSLEE